MDIKKIVHLRRLDIDDIILMHLEGQGVPLKNISKELGITAPAISHRRNKLDDIIDGLYDVHVYHSNLRVKVLSQKGKEICKKMTDILNILAS